MAKSQRTEPVRLSRGQRKWLEVVKSAAELAVAEVERLAIMGSTVSSQTSLQGLVESVRSLFCSLSGVLAPRPSRCPNYTQNELGADEAR